MPPHPYVRAQRQDERGDCNQPIHRYPSGDVVAAPAQVAECDRREHDRDNARKEILLGLTRFAGTQPAPHTHRAAPDEVRTNIRRSLLQFREPPYVSVIGSHATVSQTDRCERHDDRRGRHGQLRQPARSPRALVPQPVERHGRDGERHEVRDVAVRQRLERAADAESSEISAATRREVSMQPVQGDRQPSRRDELNVRELDESKRTERIERSSDDAGTAAARERGREEVHAHAGNRKRNDQRDVVRQNRIAGDPVHRRDEDGDAQEVLGERQRIAVRIIDRCVPQADQPVAQTVGIPADNPRVQERIDEIGGQPASRMLPQRQRHDDRRDREADERDHELPQADVDSRLAIGRRRRVDVHRRGFLCVRDGNIPWANDKSRTLSGRLECRCTSVT